jgi:ParB family chromosome partitioning protein
MANKPFSLGRGLSSLIPKRDDVLATKKAPADDKAVPELGRIHDVAVGKIRPNSRQPRLNFDRADLETLIASIREHGIIEPLVARSLPDGGYELIAGERRLRAATALGLTTVPVILRETTDDREKLLLALVENISRADLNAIEEAEAYRQLNEEFGLTQDEIARRVGKARPTIANLLRLLTLPEEMRRAVIERKISPAQAKVLAGVEDTAARQRMFATILEGGVTVRAAEDAARTHKDVKLVNAQTLADSVLLREALGTKVVITGSGKKGAIKISYYSEEEYREVMRRLGVRK